MKKLLAVGVIVLFLGLAIAPSINANISKASIESELVEISTEICGINGVTPNTVSLSKEDAGEVEKLIDDIERRLDNVETRKEAEEILKKAVVGLDTYGLLGGLSVKQSQRLISGKHQNLIKLNLLERASKKQFLNFAENENVDCLIAGKTAYSTVENYRLRFWANIISFILDNEYYDFVDLFRYLLIIHILFLQAFPLTLGGIIGFGLHRHIPYNIYYHIPAEGWIHTIGLNGIKRWNGSFWGALPIESFYNHPSQRWYPGVLRFYGINIIIPKYSLHFLLGSADWVKIEYDN